MERKKLERQIRERPCHMPIFTTFVIIVSLLATFLLFAEWML